MKILSYVHLRNIYRSTGVGRVARELTEHLARIPGVELEVLADRGDYQKIVHKVGDPWTNYKYHFFDYETSRQQAVWFLLDKPVAESYWPGTQIVYCTAESYVPVRQARLVVSCHDAQHFEPGVHRMSLWLMRRRLKWRLLFDRLEKKASMFHMISHYSAERTAHFFPGLKSRLRVVPNAASESFFNPPAERGKEILQTLGVTDRPFILVPGGLVHRKNAELILEAWPLLHERFPDLALVVINHCDPAYLPQAAALGPSCILAGFQEEEPLVALYNAARLVWFPTRYDGFGMPVVEAMASGTTVVSSNTTGIPEVAGDAAVLLSPDEPLTHVEVISELLQDDAKRAAYGRLGRERAERYRWDVAAASLYEAFESLL